MKGETRERGKLYPSVKEQWIKALLSRKYKQTQGVLRNQKGFCCLGVLCDIMGAEWEDYEGHIIFLKDGVDSAYPPDRLCRQAGLVRSAMEELACMNDAGENFKTIAKHIEEKL